MNIATTTSHSIATSRLPDGWRRVRLGEVCRLVNGNAYKESDWSREGVPIIRIQNLNDAKKPFNYWAGDLEGRVVVKPGDVLLAWSGTPGSSFGAHRWAGQLAVLNQHIFRVDLDLSLVDPAWAARAINSQLSIMIGRAHGGVGLRHVTRGEVDSLVIPLPPLAEQTRIATVLDEQLTAVERARAAAEAQLEAAKALPAGYLRGVFGDPQIHLWPTMRLGEACRLLASKSVASNGDTEVRAITTACLSESGFEPGGLKTARMWAKDARECIVLSGEVLVARSNTPELVGRTSLYCGQPADAVASDLTIRILAGENIFPSFLAFYLSFLYVVGYWRERAGGASGSMKKITRTQIRAQHVPVPSLAEQARVANRLNDRMAAAKRTCVALQEQLEAINALRPALLRRAFSGGL